MSQRQQLERIFEIDRVIRNGEFPNAQRIAQKLEVSKRVIYADRNFMISRLGAPIEYDRLHGGWFYSDQTWTLPAMMVTEGELLAFFLSVEVARRFLGTALEKSLRSTVEKIAASVKGSVSIDLASLSSHYTFSGPVLIGGNEQTLIDLHHSITQHRRVKINYYTASRGQYTERIVDPYHLYNMYGDWYLVAYDSYRQAFRNFAVGRIETWQVLAQEFERDPGFDTNQYLGSSFQAERGGEIQAVAICFDEFQARYIRERRWHESQTIEDLPDGGLILRFTTGGQGEVKRWVMQYGSHAEVLEPAELREAVMEELENARHIYQQK